MRIVFMGTPQIAADVLGTLLGSGHEIAAVYTRRDKPVGRKQILTASAVKQFAQNSGIAIEQPATLRHEGSAETLAKYAPDLVVVVAYGCILTPKVLEVPRYGCINLHVSLLPKYRGAAPIQWAVMNGDTETGVSVMQMDEGLDTGGVLAFERIEIPPNVTAGEMFDKASAVGGKLLLNVITDIEGGTAKAVPQAEGASFAPPLNKSMAEMHFDRTAKELHNLVRGCNPWPIAWFVYEGKRIKTNSTYVADAKGAVGEILAIQPLTVACGEGALVLNQVVPEGAKAMDGSAWAAGKRFKCGDSLIDNL